ncbi:MAG: NmrA family NAD(P)-binding protein [Acidobacteriaceae bacterium]
MYAVLGGTGQVGGAVVRYLRSQGKQVRAVVRNATRAEGLKRQGAELAIGDVHDPDSLRRAFAGTEGAFVMTPPYYDSNDPLSDNRRAVTAVTEAAHESGLAKLVFLSSVGAQRDRGTGAIGKLHEAEVQWLDLGLPVAAIRAAWFMENFSSLIPIAREHGTLPSVLSDVNRPIAMIATDDIGRLAADLLVAEWPGKRVLELEGPRRYAMSDVAEELGAVLGHTVGTEVVPPEKHMGIYESAGMTPSAASEMAEMIQGLNSGWVDFEGAGTEHVHGPTELRTVLEQLASGK